MTDPESSARATVEITQNGPGGSVIYTEGDRIVPFFWEFALSPALVLVEGPSALRWDGGRQAEIYDFVASEIVRQKAVGRAYEIDLENGIITIFERLASQPRVSAGSPALAGVRAAMAKEEQYDLLALAALDPAERVPVVSLLANRDLTWREVEALAAIDDPTARAAVDRALCHHLSIDTRLAAAEAMYRQGRLADFDRFIARELRQLSRTEDGMERALRLAASQPSERVRQALLWASYNTTNCAPHCAALLLTLAGVAREPFDATERAMLSDLGLNNSSRTRQAAFAALSGLVRMALDFEATD